LYKNYQRHNLADHSLAYLTNMAIDPALKKALQARGMFKKIRELEADTPPSVLELLPGEIKRTITEGRFLPEPIKKLSDTLFPSIEEREDRIFQEKARKESDRLISQGRGDLRALPQDIMERITQEAKEEAVLEFGFEVTPTTIFGTTRKVLAQPAKKALDSIKKSFTERLSAGSKKLKQQNAKFLKDVEQDIGKDLAKEHSKLRQNIGFQRKVNEINNPTMLRLRQVHGVNEMKNATIPQLRGILDDAKKLKAGDSFLTAKQMEGLEDYTQTFNKSPLLITKRELQERFAESQEVLDGFITKRISNLGFPTVDVKEGHAAVARVVDKMDFELRLANNRVKNINETFSVLHSRASKTSPDLNTKVLVIGCFAFNLLISFRTSVLKSPGIALHFISPSFTYVGLPVPIPAT